MRIAITNSQRGFTLIEMVVVIVILGILAAVALPKFVGLSGEARLAKMRGAAGAVASAATLMHAKWLAQGSTGNVVTESGTTVVMMDGYPVPASIGEAAGLSGPDYESSGQSAAYMDFFESSRHTSCTFRYNASQSGAAPVIDTSNLILANCS